MYVNTEVNIKANKFWTELSQGDRVKLLSENNFWNGLSHYLYQYLPNDLKTIIWLKIA